MKEEIDTIKEKYVKQVDAINQQIEDVSTATKEVVEKINSLAEQATLISVQFNASPAKEVLEKELGSDIVKHSLALPTAAGTKRKVGSRTSGKYTPEEDFEVTISKGTVAFRDGGYYLNDELVGSGTSLTKRLGDNWGTLTFAALQRAGASFSTDFQQLEAELKDKLAEDRKKKKLA